MTISAADIDVLTLAAQALPPAKGNISWARFIG
jgi:hypothetical protein